MSKIFGAYLNKRRQELSEAEGRLYDEPIPWTELAERTGIHPNNMFRWEKGRGVPSRPEDVRRLVKVFGPGVYQALGLLPENISKDFLLLAYYAEHDENIAAIIEQALEKAKRLEEVTQAAQLHLSM